MIRKGCTEGGWGGWGLRQACKGEQEGQDSSEKSKWSGQECGQGMCKAHLHEGLGEQREETLKVFTGRGCG